MKTSCNTAVCLFFFLRSEKLLLIIDRLRTVNVKKIYLYSDGPRNEEEAIIINKVRDAVENALDWDCEIVKHYSEKNIGIYQQIGVGAKEVLAQEGRAIFLEDDNLPELTFFQYAEEMLDRYENNEKVLWICGTNYYPKIKLSNDASYAFTKLLLPCGWASWSHKFNKYYDGELDGMSDPDIYKKLRSTYRNKSLFKQEFSRIYMEYYRKQNNKRFASWDFQMIFTIHKNDLYGIAPKNNQIKNIGVDEFSAHGGSSFRIAQIKKFCGIETVPLDFPLIHPDKVEIDPIFEKKTEKIILTPLSLRIKSFLVSIYKKVRGIPQTESIWKK